MLNWTKNTHCRHILMLECHLKKSRFQQTFRLKCALIHVRSNALCRRHMGQACHWLYFRLKALSYIHPWFYFTFSLDYKIWCFILKAYHTFEAVISFNTFIYNEFELDLCLNAFTIFNYLWVLRENNVQQSF